MKLRELTLDEVDCRVVTEPDEMDPRGTVFASGDEEADAEALRDVLGRIAAGDYEAWCTVRVFARWKGYEAVDLLGGVTLEEDYTALACAEEHGMHARALERLNELLAARFSEVA